MFPFHSKLDIIGAEIAQINMISISSHFNQDSFLSLSLYLSLFGFGFLAMRHVGS